VDGVSIPDSAAFQGPDIAKAGPGNCLPVGMCPLVVCGHGKPYLGSAAIGGGLHAKTIQMLVNILDFGMDPQASADSPAFIGWVRGRSKVIPLTRK
jgi:gamma-glutamyltranspeptidase